MARVSGVAKLGAATKAELDRRLRECGYGDYEALELWLAGQGKKVSKSALHRYGQELKGRDRIVAHLSAAIGASPGDRDAVKKEATELLMELGSMRVREAAIIEQLKQMGITG